MELTGLNTWDAVGQMMDNCASSCAQTRSRWVIRPSTEPIALRKCNRCERVVRSEYFKRHANVCDTVDTVAYPNHDRCVDRVAKLNPNTSKAAFL